MTLFVAWVIFPLVLGLLSLGCGLLLERAAGIDIPVALLLPAGWVVMSLTTQFTQMIGFTTRLATPAAVVAALAGYVLSYPWRRRGVERALILSALGVFAVYAAPIVLSGTATFAGYIKLDDTATYFAMLDRAISHGYNVAALNPSTYQATLSTSLAYGYPLGTLLPLGVGKTLVREDLAWVWQPYLSFLAVLLGLGIYQLVSRVVQSPWARGIVAFGGAQAALYYGYATWGGIKELAAAALIVLLAALVPATLEKSVAPRAVLPLAATGAAVLGALSVGGIVWLAPLLIGALVIAFIRQGAERTARTAGVYIGATFVLALPAISAFMVFRKHLGAFGGDTEYGNLSRKLNPLQVFGVWLNGDFRIPPHSLTLTHLLIAVSAAAAATGLVLAWQRQAWELLLAVGAAAVSCIFYVSAGSPWIGGKALASTSPIVLATAFTGAAALYELGRRNLAYVGGAVTAVLLTGVLWSNVLQYHAVALAPAGVLSELSSIGDRFSGEGPALLTDFQSYGARHYLRSMDSEAAGELRRHNDFLNDGTYPPDATSLDIDDLRLDGVLYYRTLVLRRSAVASRPPSTYQIISSGRYWEVWQRPVGSSPILEHVALGTRFEPTAVAPCSKVLELGALAAQHNGVLATVLRPAPIVLETNASPGPPAISTLANYGEDSNALYVNKPYTIQMGFTVDVAGSYGIWMGGTSDGTTTVTIDGKKAGTESGQLNWPATYEPIGSVELTPGTHTLLLDYGGPTWRPGTSGTPEFGLGPIAIGIGTADQPVTYVPAAKARTLCGKRLDWIEALQG